MLQRNSADRGPSQEAAALWRSHQFHFVELPCFYERYQSREAQRLLMKLVELKLDRYRTSFGEGALPVDTSDYLAHHYLVCRWIDGEWNPVMAHRTISLACCRAFGIEFPASSILRRCNLSAWADLVDMYCSQYDPAEVLWHSAWTFRVHRRDVALHCLMRDLLGAQLAIEQEEWPAQTSVTSGTLQYHTERLFGSWGFREFKDGESPFHFNHPQVALTPCVMMYIEKFSQTALELRDRYRAWWDERIVIQ